MVAAARATSAVANPSAEADQKSECRDAPTARRTASSVARADARAAPMLRMVIAARTRAATADTRSRRYKSVSAACRVASIIFAFPLQCIPRFDDAVPIRERLGVEPEWVNQVTGLVAATEAAADAARRSAVPRYRVKESIDG